MCHCILHNSTIREKRVLLPLQYMLCEVDYYYWYSYYNIDADVYANEDLFL